MLCLTADSKHFCTGFPNLKIPAKIAGDCGAITASVFLSTAWAQHTLPSAQWHPHNTGSGQARNSTQRLYNRTRPISQNVRQPLLVKARHDGPAALPHANACQRMQAHANTCQHMPALRLRSSCYTGLQVSGSAGISPRPAPQATGRVPTAATGGAPVTFKSKTHDRLQHFCEDAFGVKLLHTSCTAPRNSPRVLQDIKHLRNVLYSSPPLICFPAQVTQSGCL